MLLYILNFFVDTFIYMVRFTQFKRKFLFTICYAKILQTQIRSDKISLISINPNIVIADKPSLMNTEALKSYSKNLCD